MKFPDLKERFNRKNVRKYFRKRKHIILVSIIVALIIFRLFLPLIVKNYVNRVLNRIPGYHGWVDDIDIRLIRGAYVINGLHLFRNGDKKPLLDLERTDISIEWKSLFKGRIVSEVKILRAKVGFYVNGNKLSGNQRPRNGDWTKALKKLVPIKINKLTIEEGTFLYEDIIGSPDVNLSVKNIELSATNLSNVSDKSNALPSDVVLTGTSLGNGSLQVNGAMNFLKQVPDLDANLSLKNADVTALNSLTLSSAGFDFERGRFEMYSEIAINDGYLKGYIKPMFQHYKIIDTAGHPNSSIFKKLWEGLITVVGFVFKNHRSDYFATKVPIEGDLNDPHTKIWAMIVGVLKNAFIRPFQTHVDEDISFNDARPRRKGNEEQNKNPASRKKKN